MTGALADSFHLLAKPTGSACNLSCAYCFFREKSALYPGQMQRMTDSTLEAYLRQTLAAQPSGEVVIAWQGGEPTLMGLHFFRRSVEIAERYRRADQRVLHTLQTNGTLIDDEWAVFLAESRFLVGVSIDGPAEVHDKYRHDGDGNGTHRRVIDGIARLSDRGVTWNAVTAVHHESEGRGRDVYRYLKDEAHAEVIQFIPIVQRPTYHGVPFGTNVLETSVGPAAYGQFMCDVFDEWVASDVGAVFVHAFDVALAAWAGLASSLCVHAIECGEALALEFNGDVYPCDHFVEAARLLGNIHEQSLADLVRSEHQRAFGRNKRQTSPHRCVTCDVRFACNGGCPKDRFVPVPEGGPTGNYLCAGYRRFFTHIDRPMRTMANLLRAGFDPAEIMHGTPRREER